MLNVEKFLNQEGARPFLDPGEFWKWAEKRTGHTVTTEYQDLLKQRAAGQETGFNDFYDFISSVNLSILAASFEFGLLKCILEWVEPRLPARGTVIELGCHTGILTRFYALVRPEVNVIGIDISAKAIKTAQEVSLQRKIQNISFIQHDLLSPSMPSLPHADCIISGRVLGELMDKQFRYMTSFDPGSFPLTNENLDLQAKKVIDFCRNIIHDAGTLLITERLVNFDRLQRIWYLVQNADFVIEQNSLAPSNWTDVAGKHNTWFFNCTKVSQKKNEYLTLSFNDVPIPLKSAELNDNETRILFKGLLAYETWKSMEKRKPFKCVLVEWTQGGREFIEIDYEGKPGYIYIANNMGDYLLTLFLTTERENVKTDIEEYIQQLEKGGAKISIS